MPLFNWYRVFYYNLKTFLKIFCEIKIDRYFTVQKLWIIIKRGETFLNNLKTGLKIGKAVKMKLIIEFFKIYH
jgi:hypothetical protein